MIPALWVVDRSILENCLDQSHSGGVISASRWAPTCGAHHTMIHRYRYLRMNWSENFCIYPKGYLL